MSIVCLSVLHDSPLQNGTEAQLADAAFKIGQQAADAFNQKMEQARLAQMQ